MRRYPLARVLPALLALAACAGQPRRAAQAPTPELTPLQSRAQYVLTERQLRSSDTRTLLEFVAARWPDLVRGELPRGPEPRFSIEPGPNDRFGVYGPRGAFLGGPEYLASMRVADAREVRRLTSMEEYAAYGRRHPAGAVVLTWSGAVRP